jgi:hypothetical protein
MSSIQPYQGIYLGGSYPASAVAISSASVAAVTGGSSMLPINRLCRIFGRGGWQIRLEVNYTHSSASQLLTQITSRCNTAQVEASATKTTEISAGGTTGRTISHVWIPTATTTVLDCDTSMVSLTFEAGKGTTGVGNPSVRGWDFWAEPIGEPA